MSARCGSVRRQLALFVGSDLDRTAARSVAAHLADCPACRREASSLQQSHKALTGLREDVPAAADAAMFADLQRDTLVAVEREIAAGAQRRPGMPVLARALWAAAAVLLFGLGWLSVHDPESSALLEREPSAPPARAPAGDPAAWPWAGPRAVMRPLDFRDAEVPAAAEELGSGMMRRRQLRDLVEAQFVEGQFVEIPFVEIRAVETPAVEPPEPDPTRR